MTGSFDLGSEDTNSGPHIYMASTLQTEPSSQIHAFYFFANSTRTDTNRMTDTWARINAGKTTK